MKTEESRFLIRHGFLLLKAGCVLGLYCIGTKGFQNPRHLEMHLFFEDVLQSRFYGLGCESKVMLVI